MDKKKHLADPPIIVEGSFLQHGMPYWNIMEKSKILFSSFLLITLQAGVATADPPSDSWTVHQETTPSTNLTLTQEGNTGAIQSMNTVNGVSTVSGDSSQQVNMTNHTLKLLQDKNNATSSQAANYLNAGSFAVGSTFLQKYESTSSLATALALSQPATLTGDGNLQAVNLAKVTASITDLDQQVEMRGTTTMTQEAASADNTQAVNLVFHAAIDTLQQTINIGTDLTNVTMSQKPTGNGNLQALNAVVEAAAVGTGSTQIVSVGAIPQDITLLQETAASDNVQAINALSAVGTIASAIQKFENIGATVTLSQYKGTGSGQAINWIDVTGNIGTTTGDQTINVDSLNLHQGKDGGAVENAIQAGNGVLTHTDSGGGTISQAVTTDNTSDLAQNYATNSLQAFNYVGKKF